MLCWTIWQSIVYLNVWIYKNHSKIHWNRTQIGLKMEEKYTLIICIAISPPFPIEMSIPIHLIGFSWCLWIHTHTHILTLSSEFMLCTQSICQHRSHNNIQIYRSTHTNKNCRLMNASAYTSFSPLWSNHCFCMCVCVSMNFKISLWFLLCKNTFIPTHIT